MHKRGLPLLILLLLAPLVLRAQIWEKSTGLVLQGGVVKYHGDAWDRTALGNALGAGLKYAATARTQFDLMAGYGSYKPGINGSSYKKDPDDMHRTFLFPLTLGVRVSTTRRGGLKPYATMGAGVLFWELRYLSGEKITFWSDRKFRWGDRVSGLRANALLYQGLGLEWYLTPALSLDLQARFSSLLNQRDDNVGRDDLNNQVMEGNLALTWYFRVQRDRDRDGYVDKFDADPLHAEDFDGFQDLDGAPDPDDDNDGVPDTRDLAPRLAEDIDGFADGDGLPDPDNDEDGVPDARDLCPEAAEDQDNFEDSDGCPDIDNDQDQIVDALDACPDQAEDLDGFEDQNGCPDIDNDGDLIVDFIDKCPDQPETVNGYKDEDGCPDADSDGDGIPDGEDACPREAETVNGYQDQDGCPDEVPAPAQQLQQTENSATAIVLQGVNFASGKAELTPESRPVLDEVANSLILDATAVIEIRGYTDNVGKAETNQLLSERRAEAVRQYLIDKGIDASRITAIGFGSRYPIADNKSPDGRAKNRRIEFIRVK